MDQFRFCPKCSGLLEKTEVDGFKRLKCISEDCDYVFWNNPTPVVAAVVEYKNKVILARNSQWPEKMFGLITGFLEAFEDPAEAVLREVKEELNLDGELVSLIGAYPGASWSNQVIIGYHVKADGVIALSEELVEYKLIDPEKLRPWDSGTGMAVADWLKMRS